MWMLSAWKSAILLKPFFCEELSGTKTSRCFLADYEYQVTQINKIYTILEKKASLFSTGNISSEMVESTGHWLHNLYCAFEDL
jgi:hypothetical protein